MPREFSKLTDAEKDLMVDAIPLITILKVENKAAGAKVEGCHGMERTFSQVLMRRVYGGFSRLMHNSKSEKLYLIHVNRLSVSLNAKQKAYLNAAWLKLAASARLTERKKNAARLLHNILLNAFSKVRSRALEQCKRMFIRQRSLTEEKSQRLKN